MRISAATTSCGGPKPRLASVISSASWRRWGNASQWNRPHSSPSSGLAPTRSLSRVGLTRARSVQFRLRVAEGVGLEPTSPFGQRFSSSKTHFLQGSKLLDNTRSRRKNNLRCPIWIDVKRVQIQKGMSKGCQKGELLVRQTQHLGKRSVDRLLIGLAELSDRTLKQESLQVSELGSSKN